MSALFEKLDKLTEMMEQSQIETEEKANLFWDTLSHEDRELAFYSVIKRMYKSEVTDEGSYRHALYDVFGFDPSMYGVAMDAGYLTLHNLVASGMHYEKIYDVDSLEIVKEGTKTFSLDFRDGLIINDFELKEETNTLRIHVEKLNV